MLFFGQTKPERRESGKMSKDLGTPISSPAFEEQGFTVPCWCGEKKGWCSTTYLDRSCNGSGYLDCMCGGDFCVCHNHGEVECMGCKDCDADDDFPWAEEAYE